MITRRTMVTTAVGAGAAAAFGELRTATAQRDADAWVYSTPQGPGGLRRDRSGQWIETTPTGRQFVFAQTNAGAAYLELRDASRQMWLRLYSGYGEWRQEPSDTWQRWVNGRWGMSSDVPPLSDYRIRLGYFIPSDRAPIANYEEKIGVILYFVTELYRQSLRARGLEMKDWPFQMRGRQPEIPLIRGAKPAAYYNGAPNYEPNSSEHWQRLVADIPTRFGVPQRNLIFLFTESYGEEPAPMEWPGTVAQGARYSKAGGVGIFSAWILRDEFCALSMPQQRRLIFDTTPIHGRTAMGYGKPNSPRHHFIEDGFGAIAHELGHAFGLPHDKRQNARDIMANGFRNIRWNFADPPQPDKGGTFSEDNIRMLMSSRYLASDLDPDDDIPPVLNVRIIGGRFDRRPASVTVQVDASDDRGLRAILFLPRTRTVLSAAAGSRAETSCSRRSWPSSRPVRPKCISK